jgi:hypothetical protein
MNSASLISSTNWLKAFCAEENSGKTVAAFILLHVVVWTLFAGLSRYEFESDAMLHFAWSQEWRMAYALHPPFLPWLVGSWLELTGVGKWQYMLLSQVNIAIAFAAIWILAREFLTPSRALIVVMLLEFIPYYSFLSIRFNHSALLISVWAVTMLVTHYCLTREGNRYWVALGLCAAVSMLTKYYSVTLLAAIAIILLVTPRGRQAWRQPGPYIAIAIFLGIMPVHVYFVLHTELPTISHINHYFHFSSIEHRWPALKFLLAQLVYFLPAFLIFWLTNRSAGFMASIRRLLKSPGLSSPLFPVYVMMFFPILVTAVPGFILGVDISSRWGGPVLIASTLLLVVQVGDRITLAQGKKIFTGATGYLVLLPVLGLVLMATGVVKTTRNGFPGPELGQIITDRWHAAQGTKLELVGGGLVAPDTITFYSPDHPSAFQHLSRIWSPWIDEDRIRRQGIAVVCLDDDDECLEDARRAFPDQQFTELNIEGRKNLFSVVNTRTVYYMLVPPGEDRIELDKVIHTGI